MLMVILMVTMMMSSSLTPARTCSYPYNKQHRSSSSSSATTSTTNSLSSSSTSFYGRGSGLGRGEERKKQCLVIQNPTITGGEICHETKLTENRLSDSAEEELSLLELLSKYHLPFCHHYTLNLLTIKDNYAGNETICSQNLPSILSQLISLDETAYKFSCEFNSLVSRYNCQSGFSVKWNCDDCRVSH